VSLSSFVPGQRWVSNTESELGLGIVAKIENRRVEISFPAAATSRTYATDNAPLSRVHYEAGHQVLDGDETPYEVVSVDDDNGCYIYHVVNAEGEQSSLHEIELSSFVHFSKPHERLFAGQIDKSKAFELRRQTLELLRQQQESTVNGLLGPRVQLLPHQLYIANEVASRYAPRVLLADEVGLGKTIEAGLILHQQLMAGRAHRALIVVPDSLVHQWLVEMLRRFNLSFTILDEERCQGIEEHSDVNPFETTQLVLCSLAWFEQSPVRLEQACTATWDLLIVDEAHHLEWSASSASVAYQAVEQLAAIAKGLLLLTATPEQLGVESHFARLRLLDPARYFDLEAFLGEEGNYAEVNDIVQQLLGEDPLAAITSEELKRALVGFLGEEILSSLADVTEDNVNNKVEGIIRQLLDRHGTGRVLFRNTRNSVQGFPERALSTYPLSMPDSLKVALGQLNSAERIKPELFWADQWLAEDLRVNWLIEFLKEHRNEKVLVICAEASTALSLEEHLRLREGLHSSVFHEGMSLLARDRAAAYFSDDEEGAQVLICSEIGSEGRNFQFSNNLVLFDLPMNPDLLEQRIGRLDRIGQRKTVNIHVPYYQGSAQEVLLRWYDEGINLFAKACPAGQVLFDEFQTPLESCLSDSQNEAGLAELINQTEQRNQALLLALQEGRDRLLELNSFNQDRADTIVESMVEAEKRQELSNYMDQIFDHFGIDQEYHSPVSIVLHPSDHMLTPSFPGLPDAGLTATYQRDMALSREDIHYLTWEHPMVSGAMDLVINGEFGNTALCSLKLPPLKAGTILLEAIFVMRCSAPMSLQVHRYLPMQMVRIVVDSKSNDLSKVLTAAHLDRLGQKIPRHSSQDLVKHMRKQISVLVEHAEKLADQQQQPIVEQALASMNTAQKDEADRLMALAQVNPNIRQDEIDFINDETQQLNDYLGAATLQLDSVRVAIVTD